MAEVTEPYKRGDFWTNLIDSDNGDSVNYEEVSEWVDGTPMSDGKCDGVFYRKLPGEVGGGYAARVVDRIHTINADSIKGLVKLKFKDGSAYNVARFYEEDLGFDKGGGTFVYSSEIPKTEHNGGTIIAPEAILMWDGTPGNIGTLLNWTGAGNGVFVRVYEGDRLKVSWFGAVADGVNDDFYAIQATIDAGRGKIELSKGIHCHSYPLVFLRADIKGLGYENADAAEAESSVLLKTSNNPPITELGTVTVNGVVTPLDVDASIILRSRYWHKISGILIYRNALGRVEHGIYAPQMIWSELRQIRIGRDGVGGNVNNGLTCFFGWKINIKDIFISANSTGLNFPSNSADLGYNSITIESAWLRFIGENGIYVKGCSGLRLINPYIQTGTGRAINLWDCREAHLSAVHVEDWSLDTIDSAILRLRRGSTFISGIDIQGWKHNSSGEVRRMFEMSAGAALTVMGLGVTNPPTSTEFVYSFASTESTCTVVCDKDYEFIGGQGLSGVVYRSLLSSDYIKTPSSLRFTKMGILNADTLSVQFPLFYIPKTALSTSTVSCSITVDTQYSTTVTDLAGNFQHVLRIRVSNSACTLTTLDRYNNLVGGGSITLNFSVQDDVTNNRWVIRVADASQTYSAGKFDINVYGRNGGLGNLIRVL